MKFFKEFKAFITKGNILDMAVGVIIGGAFNTIVTTLNKQILMPVVNYFLSFIPGMENGLYTIMPNSKLATAEDVLSGATTTLGPDGLDYTVLNYIDWSAFIESIINFLFVAMTLFIIVKVAKGMAAKRAELEAKIAAEKAKKEAQNAPEPEPTPEPEPAPEPTPDPIVVLLQEIRDSLKGKQE